MYSVQYSGGTYLLHLSTDPLVALIGRIQLEYKFI